MNKEARQRAARAVIERRAQLDMSQLELARRAGVDPKTVYNLENDGRWPQAVTRGKLEKALQWRQGQLLEIAEGDDSASTGSQDRANDRVLPNGTSYGIESAADGTVRLTLRSAGHHETLFELPSADAAVGLARDLINAATEQG